MEYLTSIVDTIKETAIELLPKEPQLLTQDVADLLSKERVTIQYQQETYGMDSDHDLIELDPKVMLYTPHGKYVSRVAGKPITIEGKPIESDNLDVWVKRCVHDCFVQHVPGLLWGTEQIEHHKYTFFTEQGPTIVISTPLYKY